MRLAHSSERRNTSYERRTHQLRHPAAGHAPPRPHCRHPAGPLRRHVRGSSVPCSDPDRPRRRRTDPDSRRGGRARIRVHGTDDLGVGVTKPVAGRLLESIAQFLARPVARPVAESGAQSSPRPSPEPSRGPVDINLAPNGKVVFLSQITKELCAPAGITSALATMRLVKASNAVQRQINGQIGRWTSYADSHNGGWGPAAMTKALAAYGAPGYVVQTYATRIAALRAAGIALAATHEPVLLLAWWGAHTWVMTGYRATGNLAADPKASVTGAYIVDPWYPRVARSGATSTHPGHFYDMAGMRPTTSHGRGPTVRYPGRDGRWVLVLPTRRLASAGSLTTARERARR